MDPATAALTAEPDLSAQAPPPAWRGWLARLTGVLWVVVCAWAIFGLHKEWSHFHLADLNAAFGRIGSGGLCLAALFTALSYLANAVLGILGQRWINHPIRPGRDLAISFISSAFTMNAGGTVLGGGSIRMRFAAAEGMTVPQVAKVMLFSGLAGWVGHMFLCGVLLLVAPPPLDWIAPGGMKLAGAALAFGSAALVFGRFVWRSKWPAPGLALLTLAVSVIDWLCAGLAMWALFPAGMAISAWSFISVVVVAQAIAAFTHVPGGIGVLEFALTKALTGLVAAPALAGGLVTYRLLYYLAPFFAAVLLLGVRELMLRRAILQKGGQWALRGWSIVAPRLASLLALAGGFVLLVSANTPIEPARRTGLADWIPLPFVEASHFVSSIAGALLIVLARGLQRRIEAAWWLTVVAISGSIVFSLVKGFDWEEAILLGFLLGCLLPCRSYFHRHAALWTHRFTASWWLFLLALAGVAVWLGFLTAEDVPYHHHLWWEFTFEGDAPRFLRAMVGATCVFAIIALAQGLRPTKPRHRASAEPAVVEKLVASSIHADAALAYLGDKDFSVSEDGRAGLMHADQGRSRIVMADPLGDTEAADDLLWRFVEEAQDEGMRPVFYQVSVEEMPRLVDMGFKLFKLGEEAHVALGEFSLDCSGAKKLRQTRNRFQRAGITFSIWDRATVAARIETLRAISDTWLTEHRAGEKGFSLGRFDPAYLCRFPCIVAETEEHEIIAFANIWETTAKTQLSVDLMRYLPSAPSGVMDAMFVEVMLWGKEQGYETFNLGMAPLSGLSTHPLAPLWHKFAARVFHRGETFYNFQGLRSYKDKFNPVWEPRYIAVQSTWTLPSALIDTTSLIGGGLRKTLGKPKASAVTRFA
jgi:phosphatidylglycerol lysyltransferase